MNITNRFIEEMVSLAKSYCDDSDEAAAAFRDGSFAQYAMISLHSPVAFRVFKTGARPVVTT